MSDDGPTPQSELIGPAQKVHRLARRLHEEGEAPRQFAHDFIRCTCGRYNDGTTCARDCKDRPINR